MIVKIKNIMRQMKRGQYLILIGTLVYAAVLLLYLPPLIELGLFIMSYLLVGGEILFKAVANIRRGRVFDENFLMTIATIGAFAIKEYPEAVAVMLFYQIGELFQEKAVQNTHRSIKALLDLRPDYANVVRGEEVIRSIPDKIAIGERIIVKPGERVPLDGVVIEGQTRVDTAALTGESLPRKIGTGDEILSGFINLSGVIKVEVTKGFGQSTIARILELVQYASFRKAPTEQFITKFARYYTPGVVFVAVMLAVIPPLVFSDATFSTWFYRALVFMVISCPCALVISIPLGFFGGLGSAAKNGILVKGSNFLEALNNIDTVVFDKTGTLTKGVFQVTEVVPSGGITREQLIGAAAYAEAFSSHPIAGSVREYYDAVCSRKIETARITSYEEIAGQGIKVDIDGTTIYAGNRTLLEENGINPGLGEAKLEGTVVHLAFDRKYAGYLHISDELKADSEQTVHRLRDLGVRKIVMLTGDSKKAAGRFAEKLGLDGFHAELLPQDKLARLEEIYNKKGQGALVFVGDGVNDAPVLARADVGVAMGGIGADAAIEAADVVILNDEPSKLAVAIEVAARTRAVVWQNIVLTLVVKALVLTLGALGLASLWEAVFADVGVAFLAILNSMRLTRQ